MQQQVETTPSEPTFQIYDADKIIKIITEGNVKSPIMRTKQKTKQNFNTDKSASLFIKQRTDIPFCDLMVYKQTGMTVL